MLVLGVKLLKQIGHLAFQVVFGVFFLGDSWGTLAFQKKLGTKERLASLFLVEFRMFGLCAPSVCLNGLDVGRNFRD